MPMQRSASHHKVQCHDSATRSMLPTQLTTIYETKRTDFIKHQKVKDTASQPRRDLKERQITTSYSTQEDQNTKTTKATRSQYQKDQKAQERTEQSPDAEAPAIDQPKIRKALAPFSTICQNTTQAKIEQQCRKSDQAIIAALKVDRDSKFANMGTWKITKKVSRNGSVSFRTEATEKLVFLLQQIRDPVKRIAFYEKQIERRDTYL